jgi:hypothetical protein
MTWMFPASTSRSPKESQSSAVTLRRSHKKFLLPCVVLLHTPVNKEINDIGCLECRYVRQAIATQVISREQASLEVVSCRQATGATPQYRCNRKFEFRISMVADELAPKLSFIIAKKDSELGFHNTSSFFEIKFSFSLVERNYFPSTPLR